MKTVVLLLLLTGQCLAQQQIIVFGNQGQGQLGKPRDLSATSSIDPNSFLFEGWLEGIVFQEGNAKAYKMSKMRYNVLEEKFEYEEKGMVFYLEPKIFSRLMLLKGRDSLRFQNKIGDGTNGLSPLAYYQVVFKGANTWLRKDKKSLVNDPGSAYGTSKNKVIQDDHSFHLLTSNNQSVAIKLSKKFFVKQLGIQSDELQNHLDSKALSFDKESDLKLIFQWLDSRVKLN
ncbi:hypothetical protein WSM22_08300 [Cytophagales bacterium WSM2-2]|nr:hypothetical protein WSM22_08300 [Cytophagales bacterium WSM2-2]